MTSRVRSPLPWLGGLLALYLLAPVIAFVVRLHEGVSSEPGLGSAFVTSLVTATVSAAVIGVLGTPLAYLLARAHRRALARGLTALLALPLAIPPLMSGLLLLYVVGPRTAAGRLFDGNLTETRLAIVLAQTFVAAPFLIIAARGAFLSVDPGLEEVAASLGHGPLSRFLRVAVPAAAPGICAGLLLAWLRSFGEFGATVILAYHPYSLPVFTFVQFSGTGLPATMLPIALALAAALVVMLLAAIRPPRRRGRRRRLRRLARARSGEQASALLGPPTAIDFRLHKRLGEFELDIAHRGNAQRLGILGPSGAGKTLTLRLLAGLTRGAGDSRVRVGRRSLDGLAAERRGIGYVPQQSALLPRRTVWQQVTFGRGADAGAAAAWIEALGLGGLEDRFPEELSGGQQRRVALARALACRPGVLLLDEPFTGLDAPVRDRLRRELRALQHESGLSSVIVTHDPEEAALLADEILVLRDGSVLQAGPRAEVFAAPASREVAGLLGVANVHTGTVIGRGVVRGEGVELEAETGPFAAGSAVHWAVAPELVRIDALGAYVAEVLDDADLGVTREVTVLLGGQLELVMRRAAGARLAIGRQVRIEIAPQDVRVWAARGNSLPGNGSSLALRT